MSDVRTSGTDVDAAPAEAVLSVEGLSVGYGNSNDAVTDVSFGLRAGERLGVVGESGCGKSTLGLAILRLLDSGGQVRSGRVRLGGRDLMALSERDIRKIRGKDIALIYQDASSALDPMKTVGSQLAEGIRTQERGRGVAGRVTDALRSVSLAPERAGSYPHELSGGMRQRVSIAMALLHKPAVVIADEPTTALDVTTQADVLDLLDERVEATGCALLLITHDLGVVADRCETIAVMYAGRLVEYGSAATVLSSPRHPYTAGLLRSSEALESRSLTRLPVIPGAVTYSSADQGCPFASRCSSRQDDPVCVQQMPDLLPQPDDGDWLVACHHANSPEATHG